MGLAASSTTITSFQLWSYGWYFLHVSVPELFIFNNNFLIFDWFVRLVNKKNGSTTTKAATSLSKSSTIRPLLSLRQKFISEYNGYSKSSQIKWAIYSQNVGQISFKHLANLHSLIFLGNLTSHKRPKIFEKAVN